MVDIDGDYCIDRYEASLVDHDSERALSPFYHPTPKRLRESYRLWTHKWKTRQRLGLGGPPVSEPPAFQLNTEFRPRATSREDVTPSGYLSAGLARIACRNAGKRLCTRDEWVRACRGQDDTDYPYGVQYRAGACNVARHTHPSLILHGDAALYHRDPRLNKLSDGNGPLLLSTGRAQDCASPWGEDAVHDMVGNLDEWIEDGTGVFVGGFFSRDTQAGCMARVTVHDPQYFDYSLGTRCCQ
jgi:hypothetical protein